MTVPATAERPATGRTPAPGVQTLEIVALEVAEDTSTREITGLAVPYGEVMDRMHWQTGATRQQFAAGSALLREGAQLYFGHDHLNLGIPIGLVTGWEETPKGPRATARISETPKGDEVLTLLRDGTLKRFSIGYSEIAYAVLEADTDEPLIEHTEVLVRELSVVADPQYDSAAIDQILNRQTEKGHPMPNPPAPVETPPTPPAPPAGGATLEQLGADQVALSAAVEQVTRQVATLGDLSSAAAAPAPIPFASYGEAVQALASRDNEAALAFFDNALTEALAYEGGVVGDLGDWVKDTWVGDIIRNVEKARVCLNAFGTQTLPSTGMGIEYGKLLSDTTQVAEQVAEGDELVYGKIRFTTDTARVKTVGGWGEMSRQEIERSGMAVVETFFKALIRKYVQGTENAVRAKVIAAAGSKVVLDSDLTTADGWIRFMVESAVWLDDKGLVPENILLGKQAFIDLATLRDGAQSDAPRFLDRNTGSISVTGLSGEVFSVPVKLVGTAPPSMVRVTNSAAIKTFEAGGAPFRLADDNITNLTKAFSIYGYLAVAETEPDAIVRPSGTASAGATV